MTVIATSPEQVDTTVLRDACMLIFVHQHGLRVGQVARVKNADVRFHITGATHACIYPFTAKEYHSSLGYPPCTDNLQQLEPQSPQMAN